MPRLGEFSWHSRACRAAVGAVLLWSASGNGQTGAGDRPLALGGGVGVVTRCAASADGVAVSVRSRDGVRHYSVSQRMVPLPSDAYGRVVSTPYVMSGPCPNVGDSVLVTACSQCDGAGVYTIEVTRTAAAGTISRGTVARLWLMRRFFDVASRGAAEQWAVSYAASVLARFNRGETEGGTLWIRQRLRDSLWTYNSSEYARAMVKMYGTPSLLFSIEQLAGVYRKHGEEIGVVRALPYTPPEPRKAPFAGSFGTFAFEVYVERNGTLSRVY